MSLIIFDFLFYYYYFSIFSHLLTLVNPPRAVGVMQECMKVPVASVRYSALQGLVAVLGLIDALPPSDAKVFAE